MEVSVTITTEPNERLNVLFKLLHLAHDMHQLAAKAADLNVYVQDRSLEDLLYVISKQIHAVVDKDCPIVFDVFSP